MSDSMPFDTQMQSRAPAVPSRSYVMAWITVAMLAVGYVSVLAARPEFLSAYLPEARGDAAGADVATMRSTIQQLNSELAEAKTAAATSAAQVGALNSRIAELEGRLAAAPPVASAAPSVASAAPSVASAAPSVASAPAEAPASALARKFAEAKAAAPEPVKPQVVAPVVAQVVAKAAVPPAPAATDAAAAIETGSIALPKSAAAAPAAAVAAPVAFGTATVTPAPQPFGLQIGRGRSIDELRLSWNLLQETHAASLKSLSPHYAAASDAADAPLNLLAGPIKSKAEAIKVCKTLSAQGVACKVGAFAGEPL